MTEARHVVLVRPKGVGPSWWPRMPFAPEAHVTPAEGPVGELVQFGWNTVTADGGWTLGTDPNHAVIGDDELGQRVEDWFEEHEDDPWPWELCQVRIPD